MHIKLILLAGLLATGQLQAQTAKTKPVTKPDMEALLKMSPEERKKYAEAMQKKLGSELEEKADALNITIDKSLLPGTALEAPVKDLKRLQLIPAAPPPRSVLLAQVAKIETGLMQVTPPATVQEITTFQAGKSAREVQQASVGGWYNNDPQAALLLSTRAVKLDPDNAVNWNNLAAQLNLSGMQQYAIPMLQSALLEHPQSATLLNNLGQSFLGLGDLDKAGQYLQQCLRIDELHPEANRAMGMIHLYQKAFDQATRFFEKELQVAQRRSSLANLAKAGRRKTLNLAALRRQKMRRDGVPIRNLFEEINLGEFRVPDLPKNSIECMTWHNENAGYTQSIIAELRFWNKASETSLAELKEEGKKHYGLYTDLVNELISDLGDEFIPLIPLFSDSDIEELKRMTQTYYQRLNEINCPSPPMDPLNSAALQEAYARKCCNLKKPLLDAYIAEYNGFLTTRINLAQARWKEYINAMVSIVQLDPSLGNRKMVYATVGSYFTFLGTCVQSILLLDPPSECAIRMTDEEADSTIKAAKHHFDLNCPDWLKLNVSLKIAKLKADCQAVTIEAEVYELLHVGMEKKFRTGTSTLYVGAGLKGAILDGTLSGELTQQLYIVFDNNNEFADLGMRGTGSFDIAKGMFGESLSYDFSMNNGFSSTIAAKSDWVNKLEKIAGYFGK